MDNDPLIAPAFAEALAARQPIYDINSHLYGYELLLHDPDKFRDEKLGFALDDKLVEGLCGSINEQYRSLQQPLFVSVSRDFLVSGKQLSVDPAAVVLEIQTGMRVDDKLIQAVSAWRRRSFKFSLRNYGFEPKYNELIPYLDFIKVDLLQEPLETILEKTRNLDKDHCKLIAERIGDKTVFLQCREAGFDLFQGYYLVVPDKVFGKKVKASYQGILQVLKKVQQEDISMDDLARTVANEPRFVYQLLRVLNSPACRLNRKVEDIKEAIVYLGLTQLKKWALLILLTSADEKKTEYLRLLLTRARACERYAELAKSVAPEKYFMAGLLSGIDRLLEVDQGVALAQINLGREVKHAVLLQEGAIGETLNQVFDVESNTLEPIGRLPKDKRQQIFIAHFEGGLWAHETLSALGR